VFAANIFTLYPEIFPGALGHGIYRRASEKKIWNLNVTNIRDYALDKHLTVDDKPFGGGAGMVLRPDIISNAIEDNFSKSQLESFIKICFSAKGKKLNQEYLNHHKSDKDFLILNGRYEGIDQRVIDYYKFEELSVSDVILNGGEITTLLFVEAQMRLQPGVLGNEETHSSESFSNNLLEYDQFTRPNPWCAPNNMSIEAPSALLNGNHAEIESWKRQNALKNTEKNRPDLWKNYLKKNKNE